MHFTGKVYDVLKWIAQIVLPAVGTAYYGLAAIWHWPDPDQVMGSVLVIDTLLGVILGISSASYNKNEKYAGTINLQETEEKTLVSLELEDDPYALEKKSEVTFKVVKA